MYLEPDGISSYIHDSDDGTVQVSAISPILCSSFVSPLSNLSQITNFALDNFVVRFKSQKNALIINVEKRMEMIEKWLKDSGF